MEQFMKIFNKNLKTQRLELRILEPTLENAKLPDGTWTDQLIFAKLKSEYKGK